jgi:hypothetical protein
MEAFANYPREVSRLNNAISLPVNQPRYGNSDSLDILIALAQLVDQVDDLPNQTVGLQLHFAAFPNETVVVYRCGAEF